MRDELRRYLDLDRLCIALVNSSLRRRGILFSIIRRRGILFSITERRGWRFWEKISETICSRWFRRDVDFWSKTSKIDFNWMRKELNRVRFRFQWRVRSDCTSDRARSRESSVWHFFSLLCLLKKRCSYEVREIRFWVIICFRGVCRLVPRMVLLIMRAMGFASALIRIFSIDLSLFVCCCCCCPFFSSLSLSLSLSLS